MNIVVAMAGEGSRFVESGHVYPKPLIRTKYNYDTKCVL